MLLQTVSAQTWPKLAISTFFLKEVARGGERTRAISTSNTARYKIYAKNNHNIGI
jgi:hypothetical protein